MEKCYLLFSMKINLVREDLLFQYMRHMQFEGIILKYRTDVKSQKSAVYLQTNGYLAFYTKNNDHWTCYTLSLV